MKWLHRLEPIFWLLFGAGGFAAALVLPALMFSLTIAGPMGWFPASATDYQRMHDLVANPIGSLIAAGVISLVLWHAAHHLRHFLLDLGLGRFHAPLAYLLYTLAALGTVASVQAVLSL